MSEEVKMEVVSASVEDFNKSLTIQMGSSIDISGYVSRYDGCTKVDRLMFIADRVTDKKEVYKLLIDELRLGNNTVIYRKVCSDASTILGESFILNDDWVEKVDSKCTKIFEKLESDLVVAKNSMVKESIRIALNQIADFHYQRGNLKEALKSYLRTKEYCSTPKHNAEMILNITTISINDNNFRMVGPYASTIDVIDDPDVIIKAKIKLALALVSLHDENFSVAAKKFLETDGELNVNYNTIISPEDVAIYGTILGLASIPRKDLRKSILENKNFKIFMELVPTMRTLIQDFMHGSYSQVFLTLEALKPQLLLDIYLHKIVDTLYSKITNKIIVQYFTVYNTIDMHRMSQALGMSIPSLTERICHLITNEALPARIDSQSQTLHRHAQNDRDITVAKVLKLSQHHAREVRRTLLRLSLMQNGFVVAARETNIGSGLGTASAMYRDRDSVGVASVSSRGPTVQEPSSGSGMHVHVHVRPSASASSSRVALGEEDDTEDDDTEMAIDDDDD